MKANTLESMKFDEIDIGIIYAIKRLFSNFLKATKTWNKRRIGRSEISRLNDHMLRDINMTRTQAEELANKVLMDGIIKHV